MDALLELAGLLGPLIAGLLTVPIVNAIKSLVVALDRTPAAVKQVLAVVIAWGLTKLGTIADPLLGVVMPDELSLFTGETTEALIAAAIAFGVHAGQRARQAGPAAFLTLLLLLAPAPASAQVAVDSVEVQIYAPGDIVVTIAPRTFTGLVGDTVRFQAVAIDAPTGDTIDAIVRWSTPESAGVDIDPMTGLATFLSRGRWRIRVEVERVGGIVMYELRGGTVFTIPPEGIVLNGIGATAQLCAYVTNFQGTIVARSSENCPLPGDSPAWAFTFPRLLERKALLG